MAYEPHLLCHMNRFYWGWGWSLICWAFWLLRCSSGKHHLSCQGFQVILVLSPVQELLTQTPRRRKVLKAPSGKSTHPLASLEARTPTHKRFPHSTVYKCLRHVFDTQFFKARRHAVYHCLKEVQKPFRRASVFKTHVSTRARVHF